MFIVNVKRNVSVHRAHKDHQGQKEIKEIQVQKDTKEIQAHNSNDALIDSFPWNNGSTITVNANEQTYHIFTANNTNAVTVEAIIGIKQGLSSDKNIILNIDEILPAQFNSSTVTNPMDLTLISVEGNVPKVTVTAIPSKGIKFVNPTSRFQVVKVKFTVKPTATSSVWNWRVTNSDANGFLYLYNVRVTFS